MHVYVRMYICMGTGKPPNMRARIDAFMHAREHTQPIYICTYIYT